VRTKSGEPWYQVMMMESAAKAKTALASLD
jgi:hypothetical protein